jgi:acetyl-CoA decarbonylase/synthase complex subunit gamma|tara:strand:- start:6 stop:1355 length:1350 start_codon:yes stop_codon:yes gene_type:complete
MPLTGIEIYKLLPKTNCGECGVPTCLAFAMSLAAGKAELTACPYVSDEAKAKLEEASAPPIRPVTIGVGNKAIKVGGGTVMFRHEKRFDNPPGFAILISDTMTKADIESRLERFAELQYDRVGLTLRPELVALKCDSEDTGKFETLVAKVTKQNSDCNIILVSQNPDILAAGLKVSASRKPLLYAATKDNLDRVADLAKENSCPLAVKADGLEELAQLSLRLTESGVKDIILDSGSRTLRRAFEDQIVIRRAALDKKFRPLGFPTIVFPGEMSDNPMKEAVIAATFVAKYGGLIVLSDFQGESLFPLLVERMNIYTDPQRPLATAEGIYEIGSPDENSPVLITSNFSLTYFIVSGEIENSRISSYLLVKDAEGLSVMTAWAAGKFSADVIAPFVKKCGIPERIKHRKLIIPGYIAVESGSLEEELPGWEIMVGPRDGAHIPAYLKNWKP